MARILVIVEGETEETFVNEVLAPHMRARHDLSARIMGNSRLRRRRGGIQPWPPVAGDIVRRLTEDHQCYVTTMVDYYALPQSQPNGWPGRQAASVLPFPDKPLHVCQALATDIIGRMTPSFNPDRFIPFVTMHEFEAILFSDCRRFAQALGQPMLEQRLQVVRNQFTTPEEINDSPQTCPSRRVKVAFPGYQKPLMGNVAALEIGLEAIRRECPVFDNWVTRLEKLP